MSDPAIRGPGRLARVALAAAAAGHYVFPLRPRSKVPAVKDWEHAATRDETQILRWWARQPCNVGIATGRSGLVVVDLDDGHGHPAPSPWTGATGGHDVFAQLAAQAGVPVPAATYTVATPGGDGLHLYYRAPTGLALRNTAGQLGWRIDTRAGGGYVVAAGSVRAQGYYRVLNPGPVAVLPDWLGTALTPPPAPAPRIDALELPAGRAGAYLRAVVERETAGVRGATSGTRRHTLLAAARTLGRLVGGGALTEPEARAALVSAAAAHVGVDRFSTAEADKTITEGIAYGMRLPRRIQTHR